MRILDGLKQAARLIYRKDDEAIILINPLKKVLDLKRDGVS